MKKLFEYIGVVFLLILAGLFIYGLFQAESAVSSAIIGFLGAVAGVVITQNQISIREVNSRHFNDKRDAYKELFQIIFDHTDRTKTSRPGFMDETVARLNKFKQSLLVWGSAEMIKAMTQYEKDAAAGNVHVFVMVDRLFRAVRKDLGHNDNKLPEMELVLSLIKLDDREVAIAATKTQNIPKH